MKLFFHRLMSAISLACIMFTLNAHDHRLQLSNIINGHIISRTLHALADMQVADQITSTPQHVEAIAKSVGADCDMLYRMLRLSASYGIFVETQTYFFSQTPMGELLQTNHPESMALVALHDDQARWQAIGNLTHCLKTGKQSFDHEHGMSYFEYLNAHPQAAQRFDKSMAAISERENKEIAHSYDFTSFSSAIDIGGGHGGLIHQITQAHPKVKGALYDLPQVLCQQNPLLDEVSQTCEIIEGSFFDWIPSGYDLYVLKRITHDWNDEQTIQILNNCKKALKPGARLLIIDAIIPADNERTNIKDIDILLAALFGGKERTLSEFQQLFDKADLQLLNVHKTNSILSILELS